MTFVEVAVDAPLPPTRSLSYRAPHPLPVAPGSVVWVPLGQRTVQGVVVEVVATPAVPEVRDVLGVLGPGPLLTERQVALGRWLSATYLAPLFPCLGLMLPPGGRMHLRGWVHLTDRGRQTLGEAPGGTEAGDGARSLLALLDKHGGPVNETFILKRMGPGASRLVDAAVRRGLVAREYRTPSRGAGIAPRYEACLVPAPAAPDAPSEPPGARRQVDLLACLLAGPVPLAEARKEFGARSVNALLAAGAAGREWTRVERSPGAGVRWPAEGLVTLTRDQQGAVDAVARSLEGRDPERPGRFLLHGVTGSGKTEVYLRALERCLALGRDGLVLVPEISLTPQALHRLTDRFPGQVAVLHSRLTPGPLADQWWRVFHGDARIVVGPRSALFAPLRDIGLIVVDEEHDPSYKQGETPRYHARDTALELARLSGATVVMGSATPDVCTYFEATRAASAPQPDGGLALLRLPERVGPSAGRLPDVRIVDMAKELRDGNRSIFSRALASALDETLARGEQAILFLNRRGGASAVQCRHCGYVARCRRCSANLTYHPTPGRMVCHTCNARSRPPTSCPKCRSPHIRYLGLGTQRVVDDLLLRWPGTPVARWDSDAADSAAPDAGIDAFVRGEARVLVGTQIVTKGLHLPEVTLVGVVLADVGLGVPDFRAGERVFQLLTQVAGRAGRGATPGRVVVQTYRPDHYAVHSAAAQDYGAFFEEEVSFRRRFAYPPFSRLAHLVCSHPREDVAQRDAERVAAALRRRIAMDGLADASVAGPAPGVPTRARGRFRWHVILRAPDPCTLLHGLELPETCVVDVDPVDVM